MKREEILLKVKGCIAKVLDMEEQYEEIEDKAVLYDDLGIDSVDTIDLILEIESTFSIELSSEDTNFMKSVDSIVDKVEELIRQRA